MPEYLVKFTNGKSYRVIADSRSAAISKARYKESSNAYVTQRVSRGKERYAMGKLESAKQVPE